MFPYAYKFTNKFQLEEEGIGIISLWDFSMGVEAGKVLGV